ncbi:anaerobic ribonucleoside-triphosphate reductase activating protein [Listeria fleischmannii]|uniref:Anaerobic ribonucleoside-triphosphate reductase-activating protein n=1 Tax=Listeria fleischmannii TaxID=1069827 RepID=A0A841YFT0_9LIST|nr:anaerobic ribonucleoside-triphosphate reductase activating protein [Listeria fleischmannii]MBC1406101.1 anaerobic ribonucleoside-triphosphate reductase activating protein [Listeria welshimeri]EIA19489.1 anaerobic ribonucleoside-triphosphate reductase activating protein [Listeria fleischmannii subsp. coloradonensis]MBC1399100.1 anaerobic ribonucleoside-triphosphate reductase activating protein [Listeria fleischmannii]MBC1427536.1 anaerobic ribonucleoside-triphosphate reductase activating prot
MNNPAPKEWQSANLSRGYVADYKAFNFVDGEGVRCSLYVSGCPFHCEGCYNKAAQSFQYGVPFTNELLDQIIDDVGHVSVQGLTLLGGEPFLNTETCLTVCKKVRDEFGNTKDIWSWTGYTFEEMMHETEDKLELLSYIDVLVDGRFEQTLFDPNLAFRGSSNQRIIDVKKSMAKGEVVLYMA